MKYQIVSVRDRAVDAYAMPQFVVSIGGFLRAFADEVNRVDPANQLNKHPDDFDVYELGTFDDNSCLFDMLPKPRQIAIGKDLVRNTN